MTVFGKIWCGSRGSGAKETYDKANHTRLINVINREILEYSATKVKKSLLHYLSVVSVGHQIEVMLRTKLF